MKRQTNQDFRHKIVYVSVDTNHIYILAAREDAPMQPFEINVMEITIWTKGYQKTLSCGRH